MMAFIPLVKSVAIIAVMMAYGAFTYRAGYNSAENKYLEQQQLLAQQYQVAVQHAQELDRQIMETRTKAAESTTRTITKVRREIVKIATRDCGWTPDERLQLSAAYCAGFPDSPICLPSTVPAAPGAAGDGG